VKRGPRKENVRTRFAPSPTGDLHLGGAWTALASWVLARRAGGSFVVRVEDIDRPRVVAGSEARILDDVAWLGLAWDETPMRQSERGAAYDEALARLAALGLTYPCDCSRAEIARAASAPHAGEETVYPGTCRDADPERVFKRPPAIRVRAPDEEIVVEDGVAGRFSQRLARDVGDFVLKRGDGLYAYQLAVVVDDLAQGITLVARAADLLASTPRQIFLARALGGEPPSYAHLPLVVASDGSRLAKRTPGASVRELRERGVSPETILGELARGLGITPDPAPRTARDVVDQSRGRDIVWRREPWPIPHHFL
jgi:glutamyl-tRNA synthetase